MASFKNIVRYFLLVSLLFTSLFFYECKKSTKKEIPVETGTVTDIQGNVYNTVKIGNQWWMTDNLRVKFYNDSTPIIEINSMVTDTAWSKNRIGAFTTLDARYGLHYNWYALKKIAPRGWHIPTDEDWKILETEVGMTREEADKTSWRGEDESKKLIPEASVGWPSLSSTVFGTNESGFKGLPGGCRLFDGSVGEVSGTGFWWSSTEKNASNVWYRNLSSSRPTVFRYYLNKNYGLSVRCVKD